MIHLPVSVGEAVDKLTILDIKQRRIRDPEKVAHCKAEYDLLYAQLKPYVEAIPFYYKQLYAVNDLIWVMQDEIRACPEPQKCVDILDKNDMRFHIKDIINRSLNSNIREQKGYPPRRALVVHHLGLGDHVGMIGAVRYIALQHDETYVLCKQRNAANVRSFFADDPRIKITEIPPTDGDYLQSIHYRQNAYTNVYLSGSYHSNPHPYKDLPTSFYRDMGIDPNIRHTHFYVPTTENAKAMYALLRDIPYRFVQQTSSSHTTSLVTWDIDEVLTIDPNTNLYPEGHPWYEIAEACVNKPFLDYTEVIRHAQEIHTVESSFYCLACYINPEANVKRCYSRDTGAFIPTYDFT